MIYHWNIKLFAGLQERLELTEIVVDSSHDQMTAKELKALIAGAHPEHSALLAVSFVARNHAYASDDHLLHAKDELALLPPVSGGEEEPAYSYVNRSDNLYQITTQSINADDVLRKVIVKEHGASIAFVGTTREWTQGQQTIRLEYEAYEPMAVTMMRQIGEEIAERWPGALCAISHRAGVVELTETSVVIAVSAPHRDSCYDASRYAIERLKQIVPIWKKEIWADGSEWKGHQQGPWNPTVPLTD